MKVKCSLIIAVSELLGRISIDYQFDKSHTNYFGFLNVGADMFDEQDKLTWSAIVNPQNASWVMPIIDALGLKVDGKFHLDETVFIKS